MGYAALKILRHIHDIRTAITRATDRYYQSEFDEIAMRSEINSILWYFEAPNWDQEVVIQLPIWGSCRRWQRCRTGEAAAP
jgi:hypothetical protein